MCKVESRDAVHREVRRHVVVHECRSVLGVVKSQTLVSNDPRRQSERECLE